MGKLAKIAYKFDKKFGESSKHNFFWLVFFILQIGILNFEIFQKKGKFLEKFQIERNMRELFSRPKAGPL